MFCVFPMVTLSILYCSFVFFTHSQGYGEKLEDVWIGGKSAVHKCISVRKNSSMHGPSGV